MNTYPFFNKLVRPRFLLIFLTFVVLSFLVSQYIARNYGLPQWITVEIKTGKRILLDIYYDIGKGYDEKYKVSQWVEAGSDSQAVKLRLPSRHLESFRVDPLNEPGIVYIKSIDLSNVFGMHQFWSAVDIQKDFGTRNDIRRFELVNDALLVESTGNDPFIVCTSQIPNILKTSVTWIYMILVLATVVSLLFARFVSKEKMFRAGPFIWLGIIILAALFMRSYHTTYPLNDAHAFRQTQTAGLIRDFYREGINLFYPKMITLGSPGYVVLEFPLYQALAALLYMILIPDVICARLLSIFFGVLSILFVYRITIKFMDQKSAVLASFFFALAPLNVFYNRVPMPDSLTILLSLIMFDFLIEGIKNKKNVFLFFGIVAGCFGLVMKSPYVAPLYLPLIYIVYKQEQGLRSFLNVRFLTAFFVPVTMMILWQRHANSVNEVYFSTNNYPFNELYASVVVKLHPFNTYYFGNIAQRLDLNNYLIILERIYQEVLSVVGVVFLVSGFFAVVKKRIGGFFYVWFFSILCSIVLFFNLNIYHNFYQMPLTPILSIFCGAGLSYFIDFSRYKKVALTITAILVSFYIFMSWTFAAKLFNETNDWVEIGKFIDRSVEKNAMVALSSPSDDVWVPTLMYYSDRHGFNVPQKRLNKEMMEYLRNKNVKYLVIVDYKGTNDFLGLAISAYAPVTKNDRVEIYDISRKREYL